MLIVVIVAFEPMWSLDGPSISGGWHEEKRPSRSWRSRQGFRQGRLRRVEAPWVTVTCVTAGYGNEKLPFPSPTEEVNGSASSPPLALHPPLAV